MEVEGALFPITLHGGFGILYLVALVSALRVAPWARLNEGAQLHVFLGSVAVMAVLWHLRADVQPGLSFHLLGLTAVTLMFGWSLAILASSLALLALTLNGGYGWDSYLINAVITGTIPVTLTQILLVLIRWYLPKNFFIYVLVNGFLTAGFMGVVSGYLVTGLLVLSGAYSFGQLDQSFLPFFPLMFLPEAMFNGWILTVLVVFRPGWVYSFSDDLYLKGK